jgi:acetyl esterase/lipase
LVKVVGRTDDDVEIGGTIVSSRRTFVVAAALAPVLAGTSGWTSATVAQEATPEAVQDLVASRLAGNYGDIETRWGIAFGEADGEELLLDAFPPPSREAPHPAVILIHGGAWSFGNRADMGGAAKELAKAGYAAFCVSYRLLDIDGANPWPAQLDDVQRAVRWVRAHAAQFNADPERVAAYGYSAGAHLAMMLGVRETRDNADPELANYSSRVECAVSLGGDMDLTVPQTDSSMQLILADFLGGTPEEQPAAYRDASPLSWVDSDSAPSLIAHGGFDDVFLAEQSRKMVAALHDAQVEVVYVVVPRVDHGGIGQWSLVGPLALAFLGMHLHPER